MKNRIAFICVLFLIVAIGCKKNLLSEERGPITGEWAVQTINGDDVSSNKMTLNYQVDGILLAFDGCNQGTTPYETNPGNRIECGYPSFTYMYCNPYHIEFGEALKNSKKYEATLESLFLYNDQGNVVLRATRK